MIPRDFINNMVDTQHGFINGLKAIVDMQAWFAQKALDEAEKYMKHLAPVQAKQK
jgi:hypothetical protein